MREELVERILQLPPRTRKDVVRRLLAERPGASAERPPGAGPVRTGRFPANPGQRRQWFLGQMAPASSAYHIALHYDVRGPVDHRVLARALQDVRARHEALRTTFEQQADEVYQVVGAPEPVAVRLRAGGGGPQALLRELDEFSARPFDLRAGPLFRVGVWRVGPGHHVLACVFHHIVFDEHSVGVFERELSACYSARRTGLPAELPELPVQPAGPTGPTDPTGPTGPDEDGLAAWVRRLRGAVPTELPADLPRPPVASSRGAVHGTRVADRTRDRVLGLARELRTTPFVVLFAAFAVFLARQSGRDDISVGTPVACRNSREARDLIGFFVNTLVLRTRVDRRSSFRDVVAAARDAALDAFRTQDVPFDAVVRAVGAPTESSRNPLFRIMFAHAQPADGGSVLRIGDVTAQPRVPTTDEAAFDLTVSSTLGEDGLSFALAYATDLYLPETVENWASTLAALVTGLVDRPDSAVEDCWRAGPRERDLLALVNATGRPSSEAMVPELFRAQVLRTPDAPAIDDGGRLLTFRELDSRVDALAVRLRELGAGCERVVATCLPTGTDAVVGMLAAWRTGAAFAPLDPAHPPERLAALLGDLRPCAVVAEPAVAAGLPAEFPALPPRCAASRETCPQAPVRPDQLAYIIHTSGSTGRPKGVLVEHGNLANHAAHQLLPLLEEAAREGEPLRVGLGASVIFDVFVNQVLPLVFGHTLVALDEEQRLDPRRLVQLAGTDRALDVLGHTPAQLPMLIDSGLLDSATPPKLILFGGEACPPQVWDGLRERPHVRAYNCYGPTECTIDATFADVHATRARTIGTPHGNATVQVLDDELRPVPVGAVGEICLGGAGVGRGYLDRPGPTAAVFVPDPLRAGARLYRTGDQGRMRADGRLEFWGRRDDQVKLRGRRIELGEIEAALLTLPEVRQAAVVLREPEGQEPRITAYVVPSPTAAADPSALRSALLRRLPGYLVPGEFVPLRGFPLTSTGKVDRGGLPAPREDDRAVELVEPRSATERLVAEVWSEVLGVVGVGAFDSFFDLGGHSLLAVRLAAQLEARLGIPVPLGLVLAAPTVAEQALSLDAGPAAHRHLIPLGGQGRPLVLVHPIGGQVFCYRELAAQLSQEFEVYGLQADVEAPAHDGIEALAQTYARILAERFPSRSPVLAGWSAGGVLAHEVACALQRLGQPVDRLVLVDSVPDEERLEGSAAKPDVEAGAMERLRTGLRANEERAAELLLDPAAGELLAAFGVDPAGLIDLPARARQALFSFWQAMIAGLAARRPGVFRGPATLLLADTHDQETTAWLRGRWSGAVAGELSVHRLAGDHFTVLNGPGAAGIRQAIGAIPDTDSMQRGRG